MTNKQQYTESCNCCDKLRNTLDIFTEINQKVTSFLRYLFKQSTHELFPLC